MRKEETIKRAQQVRDLYLNQNKTCTEISKLLNIQRRNVYRILEKNNIDLKLPVSKQCKRCNCIISENSRGAEYCGSCGLTVKRNLLKDKAVEYKGGKCLYCGWKGDSVAFDFHHRNPKEKSFEISGKKLAEITWDAAVKELDKCDLLCAICHRLVHKII